MCLSDDSHGISYVGLNYGSMKDYLVSQGLEEVWYLVPAASAPSEAVPLGRRGRVKAVRMNGWAEHPFWTKLSQA